MEDLNGHCCIGGKEVCAYSSTPLTFSMGYCDINARSRQMYQHSIQDTQFHKNYVNIYYDSEIVLFFCKLRRYITRFEFEIVQDFPINDWNSLHGIRMHNLEDQIPIMYSLWNTI